MGGKQYIPVRFSGRCFIRRQQYPTMPPCPAVRLNTAAVDFCTYHIPLGNAARRAQVPHDACLVRAIIRFRWCRYDAVWCGAVRRGSTVFVPHVVFVRFLLVTIGAPTWKAEPSWDADTTPAHRATQSQPNGPPGGGAGAAAVAAASGLVSFVGAAARSVRVGRRG